SSWLYRRHRSA
ncbi:unnamed protein product, partial [Gordionus sp. m RMFG-2023]